MELILIRHGESEGNVKEVVYGHTDYPMTDKGMSQVPKILEITKRYKVDGVYSSPLARANVIGQAISQERGIMMLLDFLIMCKCLVENTKMSFLEGFKILLMSC